MNTGSDVLRKEFQVALVIWVAILVALAIYVAIGHFFIGKALVDTGDVSVSWIRTVLAGVGAILLLSSFFIRRAMLARGTAATLPDERAVAARYKSATIVAAGICEAVGLMGLVLIFLGDSLQTLYLFNGAAAIGLFLHRPKIEELERLAGHSGY